VSAVEASLLSAPRRTGTLAAGFRTEAAWDGTTCPASFAFAIGGETGETSACSIVFTWLWFPTGLLSFLVLNLIFFEGDLSNASPSVVTMFSSLPVPAVATTAWRTAAGLSDLSNVDARFMLLTSSKLVAVARLIDISEPCCVSIAHAIGRHAACDADWY
jgi:hypothetical protein